MTSELGPRGFPRGLRRCRLGRAADSDPEECLEVDAPNEAPPTHQNGGDRQPIGSRELVSQRPPDPKEARGLLDGQQVLFHDGETLGARLTICLTNVADGCG
jgi:hypothetical protein